MLFLLVRPFPGSIGGLVCLAGVIGNHPACEVSAVIEEKPVRKPKEMAIVISNVRVCVAWILGKTNVW